jgi:2-methylisocitrate lyase-like PEP mutase family enzyme
MNMRSQLRALLADAPFVAADCYSALSARIVEEVGFSAAYMGGHATGMMHYAIPDDGSLTPTEMIEQAGRVAEAVNIPLVVDADQAGETVADVYRSIRLYGRAGVAGVHIEDEVPPKHSRWDGPLMSTADMQARIRTATDARVDDDFVIIARCDELYDVGGGGSGSLDELIQRGVAYAEAGADLFLPTNAAAEQLRVLAAEVPIPIAAYGALVPGLACALATGWGTAGAARAHWQWATELRRHGELPPDAFEFPEKDAIIRQGVHDRVVEAWVTGTHRQLRPPAD